MHFRLAAVVLLTGSMVATPHAQEPPALGTLLERVGKYVLGYSDQLEGLVLEEAYSQNVKYLVGIQQGSRRVPNAGASDRVLRSDLLLILTDGTSWRQFRDVFEVDGKAVRDRSDRLARLFLQPSALGEAQANQIAAESARYNIGDIQRDINIPFFALAVVAPENQSHFKFSIERSESARTRNLPGSAAFAVDGGMVVLRYEEQRTKTMIRTGGDRDLPMDGRVWIAPDTGALRMTELTVNDQVVRAAIHVAYRHEPELSLLVPAEMHEFYERKADKMQIRGTAAYTNVRRFKVQTDEKIAPVK